MRRILVDTNVLVSFLTDRDAAQQERAARLFEGAVTRQHEIVVHLGVVTEMVYVLQNLYGLPPADVARILRDLLATPGVVSACEIAWDRLLARWPAPGPAFGDAVLAAAVEAGCGDEVATFDVKLGRRLRREGIRVHS